MAGIHGDSGGENARREAFAARHAQAQRAREANKTSVDAPSPSPAPRPAPVAPRALVQRALKRARRAAGQAYRGLVRTMPEPIKAHPAVMPLKRVVRAYRGQPHRSNASQRPPEVKAFTGGPMNAARAETCRAAAQTRHRVEVEVETSAATPAISALVLNRNGASHLHKLFESISTHEAQTDLELVVVDHASNDGSREVIKRWAERLHIKAILLDVNDSFSASTNRAARAARGELLLLLNNDIIFERPLLQAMAQTLQDPRIGIVAPTLRFPGWHPDFPGRLQHGGIKFYPDARGAFLRPYNLSAHQGVERAGQGLERMPAVTAACALVRRADYEQLGGLHEGFVYGYEDVDFCLRLYRELGRWAAVAHELEAVHDESATQNKDPGPQLRARRRANQRLLDARHGWALRRSKRAEALSAARFLEDAPLTVGLAVTEVGDAAKAGDYFTALELKKALETEVDWQVVLLPSTEDWYDLSGVDVLISLLDRYDLTQIHDARPGLVKVAWIRNWFDRWPTRPHFELYDLVLSSSDVGAKYLLESHHRLSDVLRIATAPARFSAGRHDPNLESDVAFTGSRWGQPRAIETNLQPTTVPGTVAIWGHGWQDSPTLASHGRGFVEYARMPDIYASTKIVVDDTIEQARPWGSVNSRVFDALGAGTLVVTNGQLGAKETFGDLLPTYHDQQSLTETLTSLLSQPDQRQHQADTLRDIVRSKHTYGNRAHELRSILRQFCEQRLRIAIKVPATNHEVKEAWGDYHFALALRRCFWRRGHAVRIDILCDWDTPETIDDDVVLVLRGLSVYEPSPKHVNLMWNISHPNAVPDEEYDSFDHVFVASAPHARTLSQRLKTPVSPLLQCTDPDLFYPDRSDEGPQADVLFLGNSRRQFRPGVMDAIEADLPLTVYGGEWKDIIDDRYIAGTHVPNSRVREHYSNAKVVLNDHWPAMRDTGFLSNRLFDAAACGATIVSDPALGIAEVFGDAIRTYGTVQELRGIVEEVLANPEASAARAAEVAQRIRSEHTFEQRAETILAKAAALVQARREEQIAPLQGPALKEQL